MVVRFYGLENNCVSRLSRMGGELKQPGDPARLGGWNHQVLRVNLHSELEQAREPGVPGKCGGGRIVNGHIVHEDAPIDLFVVASHPGDSTAAFYHHRDTVEFFMAGVEDVSAHRGPLAGAPVPQYLSNAATSSAASA